jgi:dGTPase
VRFTPDTAAASGQLKEFLRSSVYESEQLTEGRRESTGRIAALFRFFMEHPERLPANYLQESAGEPLHRKVCDYVAGMTDGFLVRTCAQIGIP